MIKRLGWDSTWLFAARLGTLALMVVFTALLARRLGSAGFGEYAVLAATIFIGNMLTTFGTDMLLVREIAAGGNLAHLPAALLLQLGLSAGFVSLVIFGAPLLPNLDVSAVLALRIYSLALFPLAFFTVCTSAMRGSGQMGAYAALGLAGVILQAAGAAGLPGLNIISLAAWLLGCQLLVTILAGWLCYNRIPGFSLAWNFAEPDLPGLFRASAPVALLAMLGMLYQKLSIYMLSGLAGAALTGWYAAGTRALEASKSAHLSVFTALYPAMARAEPESDGAFRQARAALLGGAVLIALVLSLAAAPLVTLLFGANFAPTIPALRILAWVLVPNTINTYLTLACIAAKKERRVAVALSASLLALVLLNLWWIPRLGLPGAAWSALAAESFQALLLLAQRGFHLEITARGEMHEFSQPS